MGSYYGTILWNDIMETYSGIVFVERIPGMPGTSPELLWDPGDPLGTLLGPPGTSLGHPGTPLGHLGDVPEIP